MAFLLLENDLIMIRINHVKVRASEADRGDWNAETVVRLICYVFIFHGGNAKRAPRSDSG